MVKLETFLLEKDELSNCRSALSGAIANLDVVDVNLRTYLASAQIVSIKKQMDDANDKIDKGKLFATLKTVLASKSNKGRIVLHEYFTKWIDNATTATVVESRQ